MFGKMGRMKSRHQIGFALLVAFAVISLWRGIWGLMDIYLFPSNYEASLWASVVIGFIILVLTHHFTKEFL